MTASLNNDNAVSPNGTHVDPTPSFANNNNTTTTTTTTTSTATLILTPTYNIITPVGMLGYGFQADQTATALVQQKHNGAPTAIILDSGSTDSGPEKLALGRMTSPRESYIRDLRKLIKLSRQFQVPVIFSSAGGDGSDEHVRELTDIVKEICGNEVHE
jgi:hypothetical protein